MTGAAGRRPPPLAPALDADAATAEQRHRAALVIAHHATDPGDARELLDMLGLLDVPRPPREATAASATADRSQPPQPPLPPRSLLDTAAAAEALRTTATSLHRFAQARIVTPARVDPDGSRWWHLPELRSEIASYLDDTDPDKPPFG